MNLKCNPVRNNGNGRTRSVLYFPAEMMLVHACALVLVVVLPWNLKVMLHGTIRNDYFSAVQPCNVGTMLQPFQAMSQQCWKAVLREKSWLRIVTCNIALKFFRATLHNTRFRLPRTSKWPIKQHQSALESAPLIYTRNLKTRLK